MYLPQDGYIRRILHKLLCCLATNSMRIFLGLSRISFVLGPLYLQCSLCCLDYTILSCGGRWVLSYWETEIRDEQKWKQKLADFARDMGDIFAKYNYCWFQHSIDNTTEVCWYVHTDAAFFAKVISMGIIVTIGLIGNILLALTILSSKRLSSKSVNFFIVVLSISNILCFIVVAPFTLVDNVTEFYVLGEFMCKTNRGLQLVFFVIPMLTLLFISIDRLFWWPVILSALTRALSTPRWENQLNWAEMQRLWKSFAGILQSGSHFESNTGTGKRFLLASSHLGWVGSVRLKIILTIVKVAGGAFTFPLETSIVQKIVWKDFIEVHSWIFSKWLKTEHF